MRRVAAFAVLVACGPTLGEADASGAGSGDTTASTTSTTTFDPTNGTSTSTSTSTTDTSTTDVMVESSGSFIESPDGGGTSCLAMSWCDVWAQDCPRGEKCLPWDLCDSGEWSGTRCSALDPDPAAVGEPCSVLGGPFAGADSCDISSMCWDPDPDTELGECVAFCSGSEANPLCADPMTACFLGFHGDVISLCLPRCHPLASACGASESCVFDDGSDDGNFVCMPNAVTAPQAYADDCSDAVACGTGLLCASAVDVPGCASTACCTVLGDGAAPPACPDATQTCVPLYPGGNAPAGLDDLCYCGSPE